MTHSQKHYLPIYELTRGGIVESMHFGAVAVVNARGELVASHGDPDVVTYLRSSAKPFQLMAFLEHGGQQAYQLTPKEIALMCASHSGTDDHVQTVRGIQAKTGVREDDLLCGTHAINHPPTVEAMKTRGEALSPNRHNCSGKHTGMVAFARLMHLPYSLTDQPYIDPRHPIQQEIIARFAAMCGVSVAEVNVGVDGCSAPNFAVPLRKAATAFARLCDPTGLAEERAAACRTITGAITSNPEMIGGPDSFDTHLMRALPGKVVCKGGAEGYQALGLLPGAIAPGSPALGIAFKVSDGDLRGRKGTPDQRGAVRPAVALEILRQLGAITPDELLALADYGPVFPLENFRKILIGQARPCFDLQK